MQSKGAYLKFSPPRYAAKLLSMFLAALRAAHHGFYTSNLLPTPMDRIVPPPPRTKRQGCGTTVGTTIHSEVPPASIGGCRTFCYCTRETYCDPADPHEMEMCWVLQLVS